MTDTEPRSATGDEILLSATGLTKTFGEFTAVDGIDFAVRKGECFGFLGPNGAGKSSTMRMVGCVSPVTSGELRLFGLDPADDGPAIRARLGICPQRDTLDEELTVEENLWIYGRYFGLSRKEVRVAGGRAARLRPAHRPGQGQGRAAVRRHEAAAHDRPVADQLTRDPAPRRAHHRARPAGPTRGVGQAVPAQAVRRDPRPHHPLHGRGRAALRPARRDGPRPDRRRGVAALADRRVLHPRGARAALRRRGPQGLRRAGRRASASGSRCCPTGSWSTPTTATRPRPSCTPAGIEPLSALVRRATLEDVFLHLTGRTLVD